MVYLHVLSTVLAELFETFVILIRHARVTLGAISHLFADCLASKLLCLMFFETRSTSKVSITGLVLQRTYMEESTCSRYTSLRTYASRHVHIPYYSLCIHTF